MNKTKPNRRSHRAVRRQTWMGRLATAALVAGALGAPVAGVGAAEPAEPEPARQHYERGDLRKLVAVVRTKTPPQIDGVMDPREWDDAAVLTGLTRVKGIGQSGVNAPSSDEKYQGVMGIENVADDQSTFWITYDDDNLYLAYHSPPPARIGKTPAMIAVMLKQTQNQHDANIDQDDCIHLSITDPVYPGGDKYVIQINSLGTTFECIWNSGYVWEQDVLARKLGHTAGITIGWDPPIVSQSTLTLEGWVLEAAIPWKGLGPHLTPPQPGEAKYMNFGRNWREVMKESHVWAADDARSPAGEVLFQGAEGVVVQLQDTGNLPRGQAAFAAALKNLSTAEKKVIAEIATDSGELRDRREIVLPAGATVPYAFTGRVADFATTRIAWTITDAATGKPLHVTTLPVIRKTKPEIYARRYRSLDRMKFETDIGFIGAADLTRTRVALTVISQDTGQEVFRKTFKGFASYTPEFELSTKEWATGNYEARFVISAPGMKTCETVVPYLHPPLPEWWNNRYGYEDLDRDRVPYPWTPMVVTNESIRVWGRDYRFGQGLLPEQVTTMDRPLLRAPMRILVKTVDGQVLDTATVPARTEWSRTNRTRVEGTRAVAGPGLALKNSLWAEYDGLVWNAVTINPNGKVAIASLELEIPLTKEFTDVINPRDYTMRATGKLPAEGFVSEPTRAVWLGNGDGGLQWFCETDGWFFLKDPNQALRVELKDGCATLRVTMIDVPTVFDAPHEIQFGFTATPVRPKTWRTPEHPSYRRYPAGSGMFWDVNNELVPGALNGSSGLYVATASIDPRLEAFQLFADEWRPDAQDRSSPATGRWVPIIMASKSLRDYFAWRHWYRQHCHWRGFSGLYYDCSGAIPCANPYVGAGYRRRDGTLAPAIPILAERDITKRLYNIAVSNPEFAARDAWIGYHHSAMPIMAYMSFATAYWTAENLNSRINEQQQTYHGVVDPAVFRAEYLGHNFGWPAYFLGQGRIRREWVDSNGGPEAVFDQISGLSLLHDGNGVHCIMPGGKDAVYREVRQRMDAALQRYDFNHWVYQFVPYWKQTIVSVPQYMHASVYVARPSVLTATDPNSSARSGVYDRYFDPHLTPWIKEQNRREIDLAREELARLPDRAILIIYNNSAWQGELRLKPDWKQIGLGAPETLKAENAVHSTGFRVEKTQPATGEAVEKAVFFPRPEESARIENGELVFPMTKWNYRMIVIEKR